MGALTPRGDASSVPPARLLQNWMPPGVVDSPSRWALMQSRCVKGLLFADYVRMIRRRKDVDWSRHLLPSDLEVLGTFINPEAWYPMESFERMGNGILAEIGNGDVQAV